MAATKPRRRDLPENRRACILKAARCVFARQGYADTVVDDIAGQAGIARAPIRGRKGHGILAAYSINELDDETRAGLILRLLEAKESGSHVLVIEPIAKRALTWWSDWEQRFLNAGGRADEWRFRMELPERQRLLGRAAGLDPRELTARSLWM